MSKHFSTNRSTRRSFLRTTVIGGTGFVVAQFAWPKTLLAGTYSGQIGQISDNAQETDLGAVQMPNQLDISSIDNDFVGLRFTNINIAQGTTILSAVLTVDLTNAAGDANEEVQIHGELPTSGNSVTFTSTSDDISKCPRTTKYTAWNVPTTTGSYNISSNWSGDSGGTSLSSVIQDIINLSNWQSGNALSLIWDLNLEDRHAKIEGYGGSHSNAAQLSISF